MPTISATETISYAMTMFGDILIILALLGAVLAALGALFRRPRSAYAGALVGGIGATVFAFAGLFARHTTGNSFPIGFAFKLSNLAAFALTSLAALLLLGAFVLILIVPARR
jgi:hypothetical protein